MVTIAAAQVAAGQGLPSLCTRHGEPAETTKKVKFVSKPPSWASVLILLGGFVYLIVVLAVRKSVQAAAWPWCAQCSADRRRLVAIGLGLFAASIGILVLLFSINATGPIAATGLLALAGLVAGIVVTARAGTNVIIGATVSQDGTSVEIPKAHDRFAAALRKARNRVPSA